MTNYEIEEKIFQEALERRAQYKRKTPFEETKAGITKESEAAQYASNYRRYDAARGYENDIDGEYIYRNVFSGQKCFYCGESNWRKLGLDRIDNSRGHTKDNVVPCCAHCNFSRGSKTQEEFIEYRKKNN